MVRAETGLGLHQTDSVVTIEFGPVDGSRNGGQIRARRDRLQTTREHMTIILQPVVRITLPGQLIELVLIVNLPRQESDRSTMIEHTFDYKE
jgi:hypothetical protein